MSEVDATVPAVCEKLRFQRGRDRGARGDRRRVCDGHAATVQCVPKLLVKVRVKVVGLLQGSARYRRRAGRAGHHAPNCVPTGPVIAQVNDLFADRLPFVSAPRFGRPRRCRSRAKISRASNGFTSLGAVHRKSIKLRAWTRKDSTVAMYSVNSSHPWLQRAVVTKQCDGVVQHQHLVEEAVAPVDQLLLRRRRASELGHGARIGVRSDTRCAT